MDRLRRLKNQWSLGFAALLVLGISALAFALLAVLIVAGVGLAASLAGWPLAPGTGAEGDVLRLIEWTAIIWLPLSIGVVLPDIARIFGDQIREISESKRKADMAAIHRKAG